MEGLIAGSVPDEVPVRRADNLTTICEPIV
jgi:hypothetical protein